MNPFIAYHPSFCLHLPEGHRFPMLKYELLPQQLRYEGIVDHDDFFIPKLIDEHSILSVHDAQYWTKLKTLSLDRSEVRRIGFPLNKELIERELRIDQGTLQGALVALQTGIAFNIAGGTHHAGSNWGEGFCLLNDQAIAAQYLVNEKKLKRILIIDLDVHQGNGTAEILQNEKNIFTFSMHGAKNFPFRKEKSDLDIGLEDHTEGKTYLTILKRTISELFHKLNPQFVFYQAGCDVLKTDKLGRMDLSKEDCKQRDQIVFEFCKLNNTPVQVSMGGGYSEKIKDIVDAHTNTFRVGIDIMLER